MAIRAFISYSHKDAELLTQLHEHLSALKRQELLDAWTDRDIEPGALIDTEVGKQLENAELYLFLISSAFIQSNYCFEKEFARACERQQAGEAIIVPIIVRECDWKIPELRQFKALPVDGKPVISRHWHSVDEAFTNIANSLRGLIENRSLSKRKRTSTKSDKEKFIPDDRHVTEEQRGELRKVADEIVDRLTAKYAKESDETMQARKARSFGIVWGGFNKHFKITEYGLKSLPREEFEKAKSWLQQNRARNDKNFRRNNPQKYRNTLTKPIYTIMGKLGWTREELHAFASKKLDFTHVIKSLDELGINQLKLVKDRVRYEQTKKKAKAGQSKSQKSRSQPSKTNPSPTSQQFLAKCSTDILVEIVKNQSADRQLLENSEALHEIQLRYGFLGCPKEDLAVIEELDKNVMIPLFGWSKLPARAKPMPSAKYPPPPDFYQSPSS